MSKHDTKTHYHHGDLRQALLDAAEIYLKDKGLECLSLRETAKIAGVSHNAPYRHFKDKNALLAGLAARGFRQLADLLEKCQSKHLNEPSKQLKTGCRVYINMAIDNPNMLNLMFGRVFEPENISDELSNESNRAFQQLVNIVRKGQKENMFINNNSEEVALFVWSTIHGFANLHISEHTQRFYNNKKQLDQLLIKLEGYLLNSIKLT